MRETLVHRSAPPIHLREIIEASGAQVIGDLPLTQAFRWLERDSRAVHTGDLFIALTGERFDGHQFVHQALEGGAAAALVSRDWAEACGQDPRGPVLVVEEPLVALQQLAAYRRDSLAAQIVGVTGSIGKTSTKETLFSGFQHLRRTYKSPGNLNSEIGLPLAILEMPLDSEVGVLEMGGAYALGELTLLAGIASPNVGVVTNVHPVHLERMGTIEAIAETKSELVRALPNEGTAVLNRDDHRVTAMAAVTKAQVLTFGRHPESDFRAEDERSLGLEGVEFTLVHERDRHRVRIPLVGEHVTDLALAVFTVGHALGLSVEKVMKGLADADDQLRLTPHTRADGALIIDDSYNASEPSVMSALRLLEQVPAERRIAVLGEMRELGDASERQHHAVGVRAAEVADVVLTFGELAKGIATAVAVTDSQLGRGVHVQSFSEDQRDMLEAQLFREVGAGDAVLIKGSRGLAMESMVDGLLNAPVAGDTDK